MSYCRWNSYCRWSSDNFKSDVYVYKDVSGEYTTMVADRRVSTELPEDASIEEYKKCLVDIGLPFDGYCFNDPTPDACADRLEELMNIGYNIPQYAIDRLREEGK